MSNKEEIITVPCQWAPAESETSKCVKLNKVKVEGGYLYITTITGYRSCGVSTTFVPCT